MMNLKSLKTFDWQLRPSRREVVVFVGLLAAIFFLFRQSFSGPQSQVLSAAKQQLRSTEQQLDAMHTLISALQEQYQESQPHADDQVPLTPDRKSTRLNSSHSQISYAVFCFKKHGLRIVTIDVQHRRLHTLDDVRAVQGGAFFTRIGGREPYLFFPDDVNRAA